MQEQANEKVVTLIIRSSKMTARILSKAIDLLIKDIENQKNKPPKGKQSVKSLVKQGQGTSNIEITNKNLKSFESVARKYGINFALRKNKDSTLNPPKWYVFFKGKDADAVMAALKEFSAKQIKKEKAHPSLLENLKKMKERASTLSKDRVKHKEMGLER